MCLSILEFDTIFHSTAEQINFAFPPDSDIFQATVTVPQFTHSKDLPATFSVSYGSPIITPITPHPLPAPQSLTKPLAKTPMPSRVLLPPAIPPLKPA